MKKVRDPREVDKDPLDGLKMLGCLAIGLLLLALSAGIFGTIIHHMKVKHYETTINR